MWVFKLQERYIEIKLYFSIFSIFLNWSKTRFPGLTLVFGHSVAATPHWGVCGTSGVGEKLCVHENALQAAS